MKQNRPALGKGLSALFPAAATTDGAGVLELPLDRISGMDDQPRHAFDPSALEELAASIRESGVLQPLLVSREGERYRLIAGERRLRAARLAGLASVPVIVRQTTPEDAFLLALVENVQREDLNAVEAARAYQRLTEDYGMTQEAVARRVGKQRSTVTNSLRLLRLATPVLEAIVVGELAEGTARALLPLDSSAQEEMLATILDRNLSAREVEAMVRSRRPTRPRSKSTPSAMADYFETLRAQLAEHTGLPTTVTFRGNRGRLSFAFRSLAELRTLVDAFGPVPAPPRQDSVQKLRPRRKATQSM